MSYLDRTDLQAWISRRDADAFKKLTLKYSGLVYRTCLRITRDPADAEDLTQDCFEALASQARAPRSPLGAWLHRVATNRSLNRIRSQRRRVSRETGYATNRPQTTEIQWSDIDGFVDDAIAELPDDLRGLIVAHYLRSESYTSMAEELGTTRQTVAYRVEKGVGLLRKSLKKRGVPISVAALAALLAADTVSAAPVPIAVATALGKLALAGVTKPVTTVAAAETISAFCGSAKVLGGVVAMKSTTLGVGAVVAIVAGGAFLTLQNRNQQEEIQRIQQENKVLTSRAAGIVALEAEVRTSRAEAARLSGELEEANAVQKRAVFSQVVESAVVESASAAADQWDSADRNGKQIKVFDRGLTNDSSGMDWFISGGEILHITRAVHEAQILQTTNERYTALFGLLQLPGDVQGQVRSLLAGNLRQLAKSGTSLDYLRDGNVDIEQLRQSLSTLLTQEELDAWEAFENNAAYYQAEQQYASEMTQLLPGLTVENRDLASRILAEESLAPSNLIDDDDASFETELLQELEALERARTRIAYEYPDAEQYALFNEFIEQQQALIQAQIDEHVNGVQFSLEGRVTVTVGST